jgi:hypothetical protein
MCMTSIRCLPCYTARCGACTATAPTPAKNALIDSEAPQVRDFTNQHMRRSNVVDEVQRRKNRNKSHTRAWVEQVIAVVKRL